MTKQKILVIYKDEIWDAGFCPCPPSVVAQIVIMLTNGEINRNIARDLYLEMKKNWRAIIERSFQTEGGWVPVRYNFNKWVRV